MKKIFTSFIVLATLSLSANAQWYLGGGTGFDFISIDGATHATFSIAPEGGYNFNDKMSAGLAIPIIFNDMDIFCLAFRAFLALAVKEISNHERSSARCRTAAKFARHRF